MHHLPTGTITLLFADMEGSTRLQQKSTGTDTQNQIPGDGERGKQRYGLLFSRVVCIIVGTLALGLFVVTLPTYFAYLLQLCPAASCIYGQLPVGSIQALHSLGLSIRTYAVMFVTLLIISAILCVAVAALLLWRKSDSWIAILVAFLLIVLGTTSSIIAPPVLQPLLGSGLAAFIANFSNFIGAISLPLLFSLFPNGRFVPRWTRWLVIALIIVAVFITVIVPFIPTAPNVFSTLISFFFGAGVLSLVAAQIYRFRRVSTPVEQQQTKWVIFGFSISALITFGLLLPVYFALPFSQPGSPYVIFTYLVQTLSLTLPISLCFGIAILRYRLWDVDVLINKTLVYGLLTGILIAVYAVCIVVLEALLQGRFNQTSAVAIVISTLVIAALFQPLRRRIQSIIDRRFYRRKYDAARTLAAFTATLRSEVDLSQISEDLVAVVQETMQPAHVSLWLRNTKSSNGRNTRLLPEIDEEE
jgi:hypothetical protein